MKDMYSDPNGTFLYQKLGYSVDVSIKEASAEDQEHLPNAAFAWPERRLFRIDNEKVAAVNAMYVDIQRDMLPKVVIDRMDQALSMYKLGYPKLEKQAEDLNDEDFIFPDHKLMHIKTAEDVKVAEKILLNQEKTMNVPTRTYAFSNLKKLAEKHGVQLDSKVDSLCGLTRTKTHQLKEAIYRRARLTKNPFVKKAYLTIADGVSKYHDLHIKQAEEQEQLATTLYYLDKQAGLDQRYNTRAGIEDPIKTVYNTEKRASDFMELAGKEIPVNTIRNLDPNAVADIVGDDFLEDVLQDGVVSPEEMQDVIETLPSDLKLRLVQYLGL